MPTVLEPLTVYHCSPWPSLLSLLLGLPYFLLSTRLSAALGIAQASTALHSLPRKFSPSAINKFMAEGPALVLTVASPRGLLGDCLP